MNRIESPGKSVSLEPLAAEVLQYFANNPGKVIGFDELVENLWGRSYVGDSPVYRIMAELRRELGDDARHPSYFETIRKRGYRLIAPVEILDDNGEAGDGLVLDAASEGPVATHGRAWRFASLGAVLVSLIIGSTYFLLRPESADTPVENSPPVIAVIPFEDLSPIDGSHIVRGLTDAVATRLAGVSALRVISQNSTRQYEDSNEPAQSIGNALGAQYLITGTALQRLDNDETAWLRVNAHLIDVASDTYLWSQTYEQPLINIFDVQSEIAERVAQRLDVTLFDSNDPAPAQRNESASFAAYERYVKGRDALGRGFVEADLQEAITELEAAVARDPDFAQAHATLGLAHLQMYAQYHDRSNERLELARESIDYSLELDPALIDGQFGLGSYYLRREMLEPALEHLESVRVNRPSHTEALTAIAQVYQRQGKLGEAVEALEAAARFDPLNHLLLYILGQTQIVSGDYAGAEVALERAITLRPGLVEGYLFKAVLYMSWQGDERRAASEFERAAEIIGLESLVEWLLQPGVSSSFRFAGPVLSEALGNFQLQGSNADPASYYLAMADYAEASGDAERTRAYYTEAMQILEETVEQFPGEPFFYALLGTAYAGAGRTEEALQTGRRLLTMAPVEQNPWDNADYLWYMAEIYVLADMHDEAIAQVETALQYPSTISPAWIEVETFWEPLRDDPRFQALLSAK
ncbi:MAG: winged helix-turn-helix domain-containing protein [Gammaproteobacteria bacterium]|nr:winged helix-turn-helix domain-containing protein [Gammaproteobacteria bacterium]